MCLPCIKHIEDSIPGVKLKTLYSALSSLTQKGLIMYQSAVQTIF